MVSILVFLDDPLRDCCLGFSVKGSVEVSILVFLDDPLRGDEYSVSAETSRVSILVFLDDPLRGQSPRPVSPIPRVSILVFLDDPLRGDRYDSERGGVIFLFQSLFFWMTR